MTADGFATKEMSSAQLHEPLISLEDPDDGLDLMCKLVVIRHADRTCKQKVPIKFSGEPPDGFPLNEDIRSGGVITDLIPKVESLRPQCRSDESVFLNGLRILRSGKEDLKVKIERNELGWILKLKWGGSLTPLGMSQSELAGIDFKQHLPPGSLDVKAFASGDTRCQETASCFLKGLLGDASFPIRSDDGPDGLGSLDETPFRHSPLVESMRTEISQLLMSGRRIDDEFITALFPHGESHCATTALQGIRDQYVSFAEAVMHLKDLIDSFTESIGSLDQSIALNLGETVGLMHSRWHGIWKSVHRTDRVNRPAVSATTRWKTQQTPSGVPFSSLQISLIGEIYDNAQYDFRHNYPILPDPAVQALLVEIRSLVTLLSLVVTPLEYGISKEDKSFIGSTFLHPLIRKLRFDLRIACALPLGDEAVYLEKHAEELVSTHPRIRLYFAHHSHVFSLVNVFNSTDSVFPPTAVDIATLGYLCEVVVSVHRSRVTGEFTLAVDLFAGDDMTRHDGRLTIATVPVLRGKTTRAQDLEDFFTRILAIPGLPSIGENNLS